MFDRFTNRARTVVAGAQDEARALGSREIGSEHLLLGMLAEGGGIGARVLSGLGIQRAAVLGEIGGLGEPDADALRTIGIDIDEVRQRAEAAFGVGALDRPRPGRGRFGRPARGLGGHLPLDDAAKRALEQALRAAVALGDGYIGTEHLLLGLLAGEGSPATVILRRLGMRLDTDQVRTLVLEALGRAA